MPLDHCPECGCVLRQKRSPQQHKFFFQVLNCAYHHWPESHAFRPQSAEHFRHWVEVQAGHFDVVGQNLSESPGDIFRMADFAERVLRKARASGSSGFAEVTGEHSMIVKFPRSIAWAEVDQKAFHPVAQACFDVIQAELGIPVEELVREHEAAA